MESEEIKAALLANDKERLKIELDLMTKKVQSLQDVIDQYQTLVEYSFNGKGNYNLTESSIANRIRIKRLEAHLTPKELALKVGMTPVTLYKLEAGESKNPSLSSLVSLCNFFRCTLDWLVFGIDNVSESLRIKGKKFGKLTVRSFDPNEKKYLCDCVCGNDVTLTLDELLDSDTVDCGHTTTSSLDERRTISKATSKSSLRMKNTISANPEELQSINDPETLKRFRTAAGYTQPELGEIIGVSKTKVSWWEIGKETMPEEFKLKLIEVFMEHIDR